jgi:pimeloyl-ACP methyl ester carboxylesterase
MNPQSELPGFLPPPAAANPFLGMKSLVERSAALAMDGVMCAMMNTLQWRRRLACTRAELDAYLAACEPLSRADYFDAPPPANLREENSWIAWDTPVSSGFPENDRTRVRLYLCDRPDGAPTVLLLHALMSANDFGYRRVARWFNERGWNAVFPHLPFHYSRTPRGYLNGELAISANLIRNAENLRQGVAELRQLMSWLRARGCREFGLIGTSFGGWNGALLSFLEADFRFLALIQPIVNVEHAIWENPGSRSMRRILLSQGIGRGVSERHAPLTSPLHGVPLCGGERAILTTGLYDTVSPPSELRELNRRWSGSRLVEVRQGHFGHVALRETLRVIEPLLNRPN